MESSEIDTPPRPHTLLFILNRNGLDEDHIRTAFTLIADTQFGAPGIEVLWLSIFGKGPDRPHVMLTLSDDEVASEMAGQHIHFKIDEQECLFEVSEAFGTDAKDEEDPLAVFVTNVPLSDDQSTLGQEIMDFFGTVARPKTVLFPRTWKETRSVILLFENNECAKMVVKVGFICMFKGNMMRCSYARKQGPRPPIKQIPKVVGARDYFIEAQRK